MIKNIQGICWIYNLTSNFLPFFIPLARRMEEYGLKIQWLNFWPYERLLLSLNGFDRGQLDWERFWEKTAAPPSPENVASWLSTDPIAFMTPPNRRRTLEKEAGDFAASLLSTLDRLGELHPPSVVLMWNAYKFKERVMTHFCRDRGIRTLFFENGFFPHTMQIDPKGINASSSLAARSRDDWLSYPPDREPRFQEFMEKKGNLPLTGTRLPPLICPSPFQRLKQGLKPFLTQRNLYARIPRTAHPLSFFLEQLRIKMRRAWLPSTRNVKLPERFLFIPFQVHDDTQIIVHSPWVNSMECLIREVLEAKSRLNLPHKLVVKEHPVDVGRYDYTRLQKMSELVWLRDFPLEEILTKTDCVITVNSSVGIEALVYGKPVVTLGEAFYNVKAMAHAALKREDLAPAIMAALEEPGDPHLREAFLCRLRFQDLVDASWRCPTDRGVTNAAERILSMTKNP